MMKKIISLILVFVLLLGLVPAAFASSMTEATAHTHSWSKWRTLDKMNCDVYQERVCATCKQFQTRHTYEHTWGGWKTLKQATCTEAGQRQHTCRICGTTEKETIPAGVHTWGEWTVTLEPGIQSQGERTRTCVLCGETETEKFYPEGTLVPGEDNDRNAVKDLQNKLNENGINVGKADGKLGNKTVAGVKKVEEENGLIPDGIVWPIVWDKLNGVKDEETPAPAPARDKKEIILDEQLKDLGVPGIEDFQKLMDLEVTGEADEITELALNVSWQENQGLPAADAVFTPASMTRDLKTPSVRRPNLRLRTWVSNNDGTHSLYLGTKPFRTERCTLTRSIVRAPQRGRHSLNVLVKCEKCGFTGVERVVDGQRVIIPLVPLWSEWTSNGDHTHSRVKLYLTRTGLVASSKPEDIETESCYHNDYVDTLHATCDACGDVIAYSKVYQANGEIVVREAPEPGAYWVTVIRPGEIYTAWDIEIDGFQYVSVRGLSGFIQLYFTDATELEKADTGEWSPWYCNGNYSHTRYLYEDPMVQETENCLETNEGDGFCGVCGGDYLESCTARAVGNVTIVDKGWETNLVVLGIIPDAAEFLVIRNGEFPYVYYNGIYGYIYTEQMDSISADNGLVLWSKWHSNGNSTHTRFDMNHPEVTETEACMYSWDEYLSDGNMACAFCDGVILTSGKAVAKEDINIWDREDDVIVGVIPAGEEFDVIFGGEICDVNYNGIEGTVGRDQFDYEVETEPEYVPDWGPWEPAPDMVSCHLRTDNNDPENNYQYGCCVPSAEDPSVCAVCGGKTKMSGRAVAMVDTEIADENYNVIAVIPAGEEFAVCGRVSGADGMYYVNYDGVTGMAGRDNYDYIPEDWGPWQPAGHSYHVRYDALDADNCQYENCIPSAADPDVCAVCGGKVINKGKASATLECEIIDGNYNVIGIIPEGEEFDVIGPVEGMEGFYYVSYNGTIGIAGRDNYDYSEE